MGELAEYRCNKVVKAGKILEFGDNGVDAEHRPCTVLLIEDVNGAPAKLQMPVALFHRAKPEVGDYAVVYDDGHKAWWRAATFEADYDRIGPAPQHGLAVK